MTSNETVILQDTRLDPDRFILDGVDVSSGPSFNVSTFGRIFFARTPYWVRWLESEQKNVLNGDPDCPHHEEGVKRVDQIQEDGSIEIKEVSETISWIGDDLVCSHCGGIQVGMAKTATGYRTYSLADIEKMVHALLDNRAIDGAQATNALILVQTMAKIYRLIP